MVDTSEHKRVEEEYEVLLKREQNARQEAERASQRLSFLARASRILTDSLNYEKTLSRVAELLVPQLADWCTIHMIDENNHVEPLVVSHIDPDKVAWAQELQQRYPPDPDPEVGLYKVLCTGQPELYPDIPEELLVASAQDAEHLRLIREVGFTSAMVVPLISRERTLGALTLVWAESGRHYSAADLELAQELAGRAALAVDNARLYREAQRFNEELEQRVEVRTAELEASNKELEAFSYSVSHDLRAPLRGIDGFSQALLEDFGEELDETASRYLQRVRASAQRMGQLIDDLLSFSRLSRSEMTVETVDIGALATNAFKELQAEDPQRQIEVEVAADLSAEGDRQLLGVVLKNLLENAWKFTRQQERARIELGTLPNQPEVFFVADNGAGFDMRYAGKLFGAFQRLHSDRDFEGTGIGLATVQRIIHRHGGRIWAEAEPDKGATFYFTLRPNSAQETAANTPLP